MNKVILIGRLTNDPELRHTQNAIPVCQFNLAVNRNYSNEKGEREADFINIIVWRKQAENCSKYVKKGSKVAVEGSIQTRNYEDKNGQKRYITEVVAENIQFLDVKKEVNKHDNNPYEEMAKEISNLPF